MDNATCPPPTQLPDYQSLPIPTNISFLLIPGANTSDEAVRACCAPNSVNLVESCYEWCEIPLKYRNGSASGSSADDIELQFSTCLKLEGKNVSIMGAHLVSGTPASKSALSWMSIAVVATGFLCALSW
jgi:hypothetical protein